MALTGQLSDMSLAELIEFFCNQRKTGRLKIDYPRGHSVFFIREGELVDAKVGALSGVDAVYFSLTLPNAAFDFSPDVQALRRTINERWTQVVLDVAVAAAPYMDRSGSVESAPAAVVAAQPADSAPPPAATNDAASNDAASESSDAASAESADASAAADAARREREARDREKRKREQEALKNSDQPADAATTAAAKTPAPTPSAPAGPKSVRVSVTY